MKHFGWIAIVVMFLLAETGCAADRAGLLKTYCVDCHSGSEAEAGLRLDELSGDFNDPLAFHHWVKLYDRVKKAEMPPKDADQPALEKRTAFLQDLQIELQSQSLARQQREGRVLIRRLNRAEYENTLHDLLGITTELRSLLPEDNVVTGFDNISQGLETSATHLVRYQQAAERALADVLPPEIVITEPLKQRWTGRDFLESRPKPNREGTAPFVRFEGETIILCARLYKHGSVLSPRVPVEGRYRIRASVRAVQNNGQSIPVLIGRISSDRFAHEKLEHILDIQDAPADQSRILDVVTSLPAGEQVYLEGQELIFFHDLKKQLNDQPVPDDFAGPGLAVEWIELEGPLDAGIGYRRLYGGLPRVPNRFYDLALEGKPIEQNWTQWNPGEFSKEHNRLRLISQNPKQDAERLLREFLPRAFRRPVSEEVLQGYIQSAQELLDQGEPLEDVLPLVYKDILCSPHFLMLVERPGQLDDYALASRLSYFLWDSMPDDELLAAAARGELTKPEILRAQTERLLKDPKSQRFVESFTGQWLDLRKIHDMKPDTMYVEFDDMLAWSMPEETRNFFEQVLQQNLPTKTFLHSDWAMINERLAKHYGIEGVRGMDFRKVMLPPELHRGGVITQASILKLTTNSTYTSPVKRGAWVLERLLGTPPSPPPPNVAAIEPDIRGAVTIRQQLEKHKSVAVCASCHRQIDPPGFALESFDVLGGWRDFYRAKEGGEGKRYEPLANYPDKKAWFALPVETGGVLASGQEFATIDDYKQAVLSDPDQITRNLAEKLLIYSTGSPLQFADREEVERIVAVMRSQNHGFRSLIHEVVQSRVFRMK